MSIAGVDQRRDRLFLRPPAADFDEEGNATIQLAGAVGDVLFPRFRRFVERTAPPTAYDWDDRDTPSALWVQWLHARRVVRQFQAFYPDLTVTAAANPFFGRAGELVEALGTLTAAVADLAEHDAAAAREVGS